jgi:hypothetical protein
MGIDTEQRDRIMAGQNHKAERGGALTSILLRHEHYGTDPKLPCGKLCLPNDSEFYQAEAQRPVTA